MMSISEQTQLIRDTAKFKKTNRTPIIGNVFTYKIYDGGYDLEEALTNYDVMEECVRKFHEKYQFDTYFDLGTRNPMRIANTLGAHFHKIDKNADAIIIDDHTLMEREEYGLLQENSVALHWSKVMPRVVPDLTYGQLQSTIAEMLTYLQFKGKIEADMYQDYGVPTLFATVNQVPFESLMMGLRGIKNLSIDLRKSKQPLLDAINAMFEPQYQQMVQGLENTDTSTFAFDGAVVLLGHSILSKKQFGEFYWPHLKRVIDAFVSHEKSLYIFCEASMKNFIDYFRDIPKGYVTIHLEQDNIFEMRKELPNIALAGGMPSDLLGNGTPEECVAYAKKLIDEMGDGYIFSSDKMLSYKNDAKEENLLAVNNFVRNYQR